ncbi:MAG: hypothetical protein AB8B69_05970 [Chitinophagales bacterium]
MIRIFKPKDAPQKLLKEGAAETKRLIDLFDHDEDYRKGIKKFEFDNRIYGHKKVKNALIKAQHGKCCFCERKTEIGDVEHYRGKGGYQQSSTDTIIKPGYYWLAYDWSNLFFCCETCNRSNKRNYFPLENPDKRANGDSRNIEEEKPLIINPQKENPENYIEYLGFSVRAIKGNLKGKKTIEIIGLDRPFLNDNRRESYLPIKQIYLMSQDKSIPKRKRLELEKIVKDWALPDKEYSLMIKCAIKHQFRY